MGGWVVLSIAAWVVLFIAAWVVSKVAEAFIPVGAFIRPAVYVAEAFIRSAQGSPVRVEDMVTMLAVCSPVRRIASPGTRATAFMVGSVHRVASPQPTTRPRLV
jgi:hypothetical protein